MADIAKDRARKANRKRKGVADDNGGAEPKQVYPGLSILSEKHKITTVEIEKPDINERWVFEVHSLLAGHHIDMIGSPLMDWVLLNEEQPDRELTAEDNARGIEYSRMTICKCVSGLTRIWTGDDGPTEPGNYNVSMPVTFVMEEAHKIKDSSEVSVYVLGIPELDALAQAVSALTSPPQETADANSFPDVEQDKDGEKLADTDSSNVS